MCWQGRTHPKDNFCSRGSNTVRRSSGDGRVGCGYGSSLSEKAVCWFLFMPKLNGCSDCTPGCISEAGSCTRKRAIGLLLTYLSIFHCNSGYRVLIALGQPWGPQCSMKKWSMSDNIHANATIRRANMIIDE